MDTIFATCCDKDSDLQNPEVQSLVNNVLWPNIRLCIYIHNLEILFRLFNLFLVLISVQSSQSCFCFVIKLYGAGCGVVPFSIRQKHKI